ncbi:MAG TPA: hypothetical protein VD997_17845 [Phycisphaerales bacterium]|nr:hypothetical protein [Phycisphaerales bacterium]
MLWHRWCSPLLLGVVVVWFATGWVGCAVQTAGTRVEVSSGRVLVAHARERPLERGPGGFFRLGEVRRGVDVFAEHRDPDALLDQRYRHPRRQRWEWLVYDDSRHDLFSVWRDRSWSLSLWPVGALLFLWNACVVSYRLGARRGHRCQKCGYDRRGLARGAACPECGRAE